MSIWEKQDQYMAIGYRLEVSANSVVSPLVRDTFQSKNKKLHEFSEEGFTDKDQKFYFDLLEQLSFREVYRYHGAKYYSGIFLAEDSLVELSFKEDSAHMALIGYSQDLDKIEKLRRAILDNIKPAPRKGNIYAIVNNGGRLGLNIIGTAGIPLHEKNYNPEVLKAYKATVKDLRSSSPSGRIVILEGEPGTGKTHLIRAFLMEVPSAMFVLVSPDLVPMMAGPEFLPLLLSQREAHGANAPIILVLEDADKCLVTRQGDNINSIQSLLNLGDGILGSMLDIRIIATTNAKKLEMEAALLRPGRLSQRIEVGPLEKEVAKKLFESLCPDVKEYPNELHNARHITLAEVYQSARKHGWEPPETKHSSPPEMEDVLKVFRAQ